jgi:hypothetical protein
MMIGKNATAALAPAALMLVLLGRPAMADEVTVAENGTPLTLAPARDAPTEWKLNSGFPLTVLEARGDWLRVQSASLPDEGGELWVRASQVASVGGEGAASAATGALEKPIGYRVELTGTPGMKFRLQCRSMRPGYISYRPHYNKLPQSYEYSADPLACVVWKKEHNGELQVTLVEIYPSKERILGTAATQDAQDYPISIFARSRGPASPTSMYPRSNTPWGPAAVVRATKDDLILAPSAGP